MNEIHEQTTDAQPEELDDFDVEGHGLREVALTLGAATVVASGASAALALDNPAPNTTRGADAAIAGIQRDVTDRATWADGVAGGVVRDAVTQIDGAARLAGTTADSAVTALRPIGDQATGVVTQATTLAGDVASDPVGSSDRLVDGAVSDVRATRDGAVSTVNQEVSNATTLAFGVVSDTDRAVSGTVSGVDRTAAEALRTVSPTAEVEHGDEGTTVKAGAAGKTATVTTR